MNAAAVRRELKRYADTDKAAFFPRFFKTGPGQYGEGDVFMGVTVPNMRVVAKQFSELPLKQIEALLDDEVHELRLTGLLILVRQFERGDESQRKTIVTFYLSHLKRVNNWDLVDSSASYILGASLIGKDTALLDKLAASTHLWTQRVAIVATHAFIRTGELSHTFRISKALLSHKHDLIHKAVGWMLREAGKRDEKALRVFLDKYGSCMPRTALRYAIERLDEPVRQRYLKA
jgi:3-methyladenine DNA glycosylase AlkD